MAIANQTIDKIIWELVAATHPKIREWMDNGEITAVESLWDESKAATIIRIGFRCGINVAMEFEVWGRNDVSFAEDQLKLVCLLKSIFTEEKIAKLALMKEANYNGKTICMEF